MVNRDTPPGDTRGTRTQYVHNDRRKRILYLLCTCNLDRWTTSVIVLTYDRTDMTIER